MEAPHQSLRKIIKTRRAFSNQESALELLFLAIPQAAKKWAIPVSHWREALNNFTNPLAGTHAGRAEKIAE